MRHNVLRVGPQVFLVNHTFLSNYESHYSAIAVLSRVCQESKASRILQHLVVVTVIRRRPIRMAISLFAGIGDQRPRWTLRLAWLGLPVKSILFPGAAYNPLRITPRRPPIMCRRCIFLLGGDNALADIDC